MEAKRSRRGWADAFAGVMLVAVLFFCGCSVFARPSGSLVPAEQAAAGGPDPAAELRTTLKIDLRADRAVYMEEVVQQGIAVVPAPVAADVQCVARYGAGHCAVAIVNAEFVCVNPDMIRVGALSRLCAARFPDSTAALLVQPELVLYCRTKGKAI